MKALEDITLGSEGFALHCEDSGLHVFPYYSSAIQIEPDKKTLTVTFFGLVLHYQISNCVDQALELAESLYGLEPGGDQSEISEEEQGILYLYRQLHEGEKENIASVMQGFVDRVEQ